MEYQKHRARRLAIVLWLAAVAHTPFGFAGEASLGMPSDQAGDFHYSDDWKIVSAPPPPGPYATVNVDPRVPGQDVTRPVPADVLSVDSPERTTSELARLPAPAAGRPAYTPPPPAGAYGAQDYGRYPAHRYDMRGFRDYPRRQAYPGYGRDYNQGYRYHAPYGQQDVPIPPYAVMPGR